MSMRRVKLDRIDLQILQDLQDDGRMTNVELARRAGISAPPCLRRVRALEEAGYIKGYHAKLDGEALGFEVTFFALVGLNGQSDAILSGFEAQVGHWPEVRESQAAGRTRNMRGLRCLRGLGRRDRADGSERRGRDQRSRLPGRECA